MLLKSHLPTVIEEERKVTFPYLAQWIEMPPVTYFQLYFGKGLKENSASSHNFYCRMGAAKGINTVMMGIAIKKPVSYTSAHLKSGLY